MISGEALAALAGGLATTLLLSLAAFVMALVLGTLLAVGRESVVPPVRWLCGTFTEIVRNIPILVLIFLIVYGLPYVGLKIELLPSCLIVLALYEAAFVCETLRAGINTVSVGETSAARALGLGSGQITRKIVLPQAFRSVVQPLGNVFINTVLNSSISATVGVADLTGAAQRLNINTIDVAVFFGSALGYVALTLTGGLIAGKLDSRWRFAR